MSATVRTSATAQQEARKARDASNTSRKAGMLTIGMNPATVRKPPARTPAMVGNSRYNLTTYKGTCNSRDAKSILILIFSSLWNGEELRQKS
jgi:hypothetical protein